mgnify:FL=1
MLMFKVNDVSRESTTENEWLEDIFYRSNIYGSKTNAQFALRVFDIFCKEKLGLEDHDIDKMKYELHNNSDEDL